MALRQEQGEGRAAVRRWAPVHVVVTRTARIGAVTKPDPQSTPQDEHGPAPRRGQKGRRAAVDRLDEKIDRYNLAVPDGRLTRPRGRGERAEARFRRRLGLAMAGAAAAVALMASTAMARPVEPVPPDHGAQPSGPYDGAGMGVGRGRGERDALPPSPPAVGRLPGRLAEAVAAKRPRPWQRLTPSARSAPPASPFHATTWVSFYGRPGVEVMGVLGEHDVDELVGLMRIVASEYDSANGPRLGVEAAFHLVYGMATNRQGNSGHHLSYLSQETTALYVDRAAEEGYGVILDVQIGALSPAEAIAPALDWVEKPGVHLALDPEFAMAPEVQELPGDPIGHVTAEEINEVQRVIRERMVAAGVKEHKMVVIHQFLPSMIADKEAIEAIPGVDVVLSMDGFGHPRAKIGKYNRYTDGLPFAALKLFYHWDDPLLTPAQALGAKDPGGEEWIQTLPNLVIYQ